METIFLGIIAFSMVTVAVMAIVRTILWIILILKLKKFIDTLYLDYNKIYSPKISILIENMTSISGIFRIVKFFTRRK